MTLEPTLVAKIDHLVDDLQDFFDLGMPTLTTQIKQDFQYLKTICDLEEINYRPYINHYKQRIREVYRK